MSIEARGEDISELLREGRHREAADRLREQGELARAMELYAEVWAFDEAAEVALEIGKPVTALRYFLDGKQVERAASLHADLLRGDPAHAAEAAALYDARKLHGAAAELSEAAGDLESAARQHHAAHDSVGAARCLEQLGRYREAGRAYEQRLRDEPGDTVAALQLGRILLRFGRFEAAARHLQTAVRETGIAPQALRALVVALTRQGFAEAARAALADLRRLDPSAPSDASALCRVFDEGLEPGGPSETETRWLAGRYRVERLLGGGAVGRVYLARDAFYDRSVAVKVFSASSSGSGGRDAYSRFVREARVSAALSHPHIVAVHEFNPDSAFLVMEHMTGGTLEERLGAPETMSLGQSRTVALGVLEALEASHARGVVHRDVKPANIFFDAAGTVKLGDFGTAHLLDLGATQTGAFLGTLAFMAPEQITGGAVDASTDLYALGIVLYRMLTGSLPFLGPDFVTQHLSEEPTPPSRRRPELGDVFDGAIARALAKKPADRFRSASDMAQALRGLSWVDPAKAPPPAAIASDPEPKASAEPFALHAPDRFEVVRERPDGSCELFDRLLGRRVLRVRADEERLRLLSRFGRLQSPYVQAVLRVELETGEVLLELPGEPAGVEALPHPDVTRALEAIHAAGLVHGRLSVSQVRLDEAGAVLMIDEATGQGSPADDRRAVQVDMAR